MKVEPLYGLPVEEPGDVEGWSINSGQPGALLADAIAAELDRIQTDIAAFTAAFTFTLPRVIQTGRALLPRTTFVNVVSPFFNSAYLRGAETIVFDQPFDETPAVVLIPNNTDLAGFSIEASASNVSTSGFTARVAVAGSFTGTFSCGWIAAERTQ